MKTFLCLALLTLALPAAAAWPGHFTIYAIGAKSTPNKHGKDDLQSLNLEASWALKHSIDVGVVFAPTFMSQPTTFLDDFHESENVRAASLSLLARHTFAQRGSVRPYVELSSGPIYASKRVPESTSHFNFISQAGVGVMTTSTRMPLMLGIRFFHISNAGYADSNPGINFTAIVFGARFR